MTIQKNVANQRLHFVMVDATDFATPEPGINTTNQYCKDNGAWSTCSNTESEINSGLYCITLAATETNAGVVTFKFTGAGCARQLITVYPEDGYKAGISDILSTLDDPVTDYLISTLNVAKSILVDTSSILTDTATTLDDKIDSILADTGTTLPATLSDINSGLDLTFTRVGSILTDTSSTLLNRTTSIVDQVSQILADTGTTLENRQTSILNKVSSILTDTGSTLDNKIDSILADTNTISNLGAGSDSAILSTLDGPIVTTIGNKITSILADTNTISNLGAGSDSAILSTLDGPIVGVIGNKVTSILGKSTSILTDTGTTLENRTTSIVDQVSQILADTGTTLQNQVASILVDTGTTLPATLSDINSGLDVAADKVTSILADTKTDGVVVNTHTATGKSEINAEVVDALGTDTIAEMAQGIPPATPTMQQALMYLYMAWRNETNTTATLHSVKNDAGTVICKATLSDDATTFVKAEFVSGA